MTTPTAELPQDSDPTAVPTAPFSNLNTLLPSNASLETDTTTLYSLDTVAVATAQSGGGSYAPGDQVTLTGSTLVDASGIEPTIGVTATKVMSASVVTGGTTVAANGSYPAAGSTGADYAGDGSDLATFTLTVTAGVVTGVVVLTAGIYVQNPTTLTAEPVVGGTGITDLSGCTLSLKMGIEAVDIVATGIVGATASNPVAQGSTTGAGTGATFTGTWFNAAQVVDTVVQQMDVDPNLGQGGNYDLDPNTGLLQPRSTPLPPPL